MDEIARQAVETASGELIKTYGIGIALLVVSLFGAIAIIWRSWAKERSDHKETRDEATVSIADLNKQLNDAIRDSIKQQQEKDRLYERSLEVYEVMAGRKGRS